MILISSKSLLNDFYAFALAIEKTEQQLAEEQLADDIKEGAEHINWLISEYGDDVFPDQD